MVTIECKHTFTLTLDLKTAQGLINVLNVSTLLRTHDNISEADEETSAEIYEALAGAGLAPEHR